MEDSEISLPSLLREEDESCLEQLDHCNKDEDLNICSISEPDSQYVEMLIKKETISQSNRCNNVERSTHRDAIKWILHARSVFGFHFRTAYLSLIYFDRFFSRRSIDNGKLWAIRLLSVACLSLAAKMEECEVPKLSEYCVDEYSFEGNVIQRMELLVLNTLEWKMSFATPFTYLNYFITKFCGEFRQRKEVINRAVDLVLAVVEEINMVDHRPSIIAAAAVLAAYDYHLTNKIVEIKINAVPSWGSIEKEHTLTCYSLLQEIGMLKCKSSLDLLSTPSSSIDVLDDSMIRPAARNKRRLICTDGDQHCSQPKMSKQ